MGGARRRSCSACHAGLQHGHRVLMDLEEERDVLFSNRRVLAICAFRRGEGGDVGTEVWIAMALTPAKWGELSRPHEQPSLP